MFLCKVTAVMETDNNKDNILRFSKDIIGQRVKNYLDQHYAEQISLQQISEELRVSWSYLSHVFKALTGYSPFQYVLHRRIGEAQTLLLETDLSIQEIAFQVGYQTQSYFTQRFSKLVGVSPMRYRKSGMISPYKRTCVV